MKKSEVKIPVKLGDVLDSGHWATVCDKYGLNEWCINEGRADRDDTIDITIADAERYGLLKNDDENDNLK
jgi:hypothetical protein